MTRAYRHICITVYSESGHMVKVRSWRWALVPWVAQTSDPLPHHRAMTPSSLWLLRLTFVHLQTHLRTHFLWLFTYTRVMESCTDTHICWFAAAWNSEIVFVILNYLCLRPHPTSPQWLLSCREWPVKIFLM